MHAATMRGIRVRGAPSQDTQLPEAVVELGDSIQRVRQGLVVLRQAVQVRPPKQGSDPLLQLRPLRVVFGKEAGGVDAPGRRQAETEVLVDPLLLRAHPVASDRLGVGADDALLAALVASSHDRGDLTVDLLAAGLPHPCEASPHGESAPLVGDRPSLPGLREVLEVHAHAGEARRIVQLHPSAVKGEDADEVVDPAQALEVRVVGEQPHVQGARHHGAALQHARESIPDLGEDGHGLFDEELLPRKAENAQAVTDGSVGHTVVEEHDRMAWVVFHDGRAVAHDHERLQVLGSRVEPVGIQGHRQGVGVAQRHVSEVHAHVFSSYSGRAYESTRVRRLPGWGKGKARLLVPP